MADYFTGKLFDAIEAGTKEVIEEVEAVINAEADKLISDLEKASPRHESENDNPYHTGDYYKSWYKTDRTINGQKRLLVRNKRADLTGILEYGRIIHGRLRGKTPHIEQCKKRCENRLIKRLGG